VLETDEGASPLFLRSLPLLREAARRGPVADLACGRGRHALAAARQGLATLGLDRDAEALRALSAAARRDALPLRGVRCDLETGRGIPVRTGSCGAILVFRFLFRPLAPAIEAALAPGGLLLYETFTELQRELGGHPRNPAFLLREGELPTLFPRLVPLESGEELRDGPDGRRDALAFLAARRPA
jgi:tellurite methyltransferase